MDNRSNALQDLFSRASTPPSSQPQHQLFNTTHPQDSSSSSNQIDSLFNHLSSQPDQQTPQQSSLQASHAADQTNFNNSAPVTPSMSLTDEPTNSTISTSQTAASVSSDRQSALLSLLGGTSSGMTARSGAGPPAPQQVPTPPGSSQRSNASPTHNETQGKILLEQLMAGNPTRSSFPDNQRGPQPAQPAAAPSPPYGSSQREGDYRPYAQHEQTSESSARIQIPVQQTSQPQQQVQPPSPRRSMFDFTSAFEHLSTTTAPSAVKKKAVPQQSASASSGNEDMSSWSTVSDPKRQSVENLLEHLTRGQPAQQAPASIQAQVPAYETYLNSGDFNQGEPVALTRVPPPPLPPKPISNRPNSPPRTSPPKTHVQRSQARQVESPQGLQGSPLTQSQNLGRREKENSPGPRGGTKAKAAVSQAKYGTKNQLSPSPQVQNIVYDVSRPLEEILAPRDAIKSTAIALVKQETMFLPGTTIGATHWVAYAMTRGRVRVISRSSGDRTLLQLPSVFPTTSSVTDMAVFVNRLAGITSDGGFVVWELPEVITDDVPGLLLLCVPPTGDSDALRSVRWHPKDPDTLAVASENKIFVLDLAHSTHNQPLAHADLHHIGFLHMVSSPVVAFDFDVQHYSIASISEDSTLTIWNMHERIPYATHKIRGEGTPSSLTFVDGGLVVGRNNGTVFQLLSMTTKTVLSNIKFINGAQEDNDMFGHVRYDSRIQTLWVANSRRESLIAFKIGSEPSYSGSEDGKVFFDQVVEFIGPKSTIHFVILTPDADPHGDEAHAACVAAKITPGEVALVAFSVHSSGVDQILIRKEWFESAFHLAPAKFPSYQLPQPPNPQVTENKVQRQGGQVPVGGPQQQAPTNSFNPRSRTPPSETEGDFRDNNQYSESKNRGNKGKNPNDVKEKDKKLSDSAIINDSSLGQALTKEIRKTEENIHARISRLLGKEMDKQNQRLEDARAHEQAEDFARQENLIKLISTELTRNTTRVVEMAVKHEVQNSVLPSLEKITKNEVKSALSEHIGRGLVDLVSQTLPIEMEKLLLRPDISSHFAHVLSSNLTPLIERHVKDAITKTFIPVYSQQSSVLHQELLRDLRGEVHNMKNELSNWQNEAARNHETSIRELELTVRALSEQVKFLSLNNAGTMHHLQQSQQTRSSPGGVVPPLQGNLNQSHLRNQNLPPTNPPPSNYSHNHGSYQQQQQQQPMHGPWFVPSIAAPQASHPATIPQATQSQPHQERSPPVPAEQWDEVYLGVLHTQDATKLRDLLARTNPDLVMPLNGQCLVSQAVVLTLVHRLSAVVGESPPNDESYKTSLWWLQRAIAVLRPDDKLITDFIPRVVPNVQHLLTTTKQRLSILPGGPSTIETIRILTDIQESLRRKAIA